VNENPEAVASSEAVTRYCTNSLHVKATANGPKLKHGAFMPPADLQLSVLRIDSLDEDEIWLVGDALVPHPPRFGTRSYRADLAVSEVRAAMLDVVAAPAPHPKHANIVGLPALREEQLETAKLLRDRAELKKRA